MIWSHPTESSLLMNVDGWSQVSQTLNVLYIYLHGLYGYTFKIRITWILLEIMSHLFKHHRLRILTILTFWGMVKNTWSRSQRLWNNVTNPNLLGIPKRSRIFHHLGWWWTSSLANRMLAKCRHEKSQGFSPQKKKGKPMVHSPLDHKAPAISWGNRGIGDDEFHGFFRLGIPTWTSWQKATPQVVSTSYP